MGQRITLLDPLGGIEGGREISIDKDGEEIQVGEVSNPRDPI
jgi:hypothetical protein